MIFVVNMLVTGLGYLFICRTCSIHQVCISSAFYILDKIQTRKKKDFNQCSFHDPCISKHSSPRHYFISFQLHFISTSCLQLHRSRVPSVRKSSCLNVNAMSWCPLSSVAGHPCSLATCFAWLSAPHWLQFFFFSYELM